jgi:hypothetical protein
MEALTLWLLDQVRGVVQKRRRVHVGVHQAYFTGSSVPHQFIKVTNLSPTREIEVTHVWVEGQPNVNVVLKERPLPKRLRPDEQTEFWIPAADVAHVRNVERAVRVRVTNGKVIKSRVDKNLPDQGYVAGWDFSR